MIDPDTGAITVDEPLLVISHLTTLQDLMPHAVTDPKVPTSLPPWSSVRLPRVYIQREPWVIIAAFHDSRLDSVSLTVARPEFGADWSQWSEQRERSRQSFHDEVLLRDLGGTSGVYRFDWGVVTSIYDERSGGALISVRYTPTRP